VVSTTISRLGKIPPRMAIIASRPFSSGICRSNKGDVGKVSAELLNRLAPIRGFGHQAHIRLIADEPGNPREEERMVVDRQNSYPEPGLIPEGLAPAGFTLMSSSLSRWKITGSDGAPETPHRQWPPGIFSSTSVPDSISLQTSRLPEHTNWARFAHARQAPVGRCVPPFIEDLRIDALSVVPHAGSRKLPFAVLDLPLLSAAPPRAGKAFTQRLGADPVKLRPAEIGWEIPRRTPHLK